MLEGHLTLPHRAEDTATVTVECPTGILLVQPKRGEDAVHVRWHKMRINFRN